MRKYVFILLIIALVLVAAFVGALLAGGHVDEAMRVAETAGEALASFGLFAVFFL